MLLARDDLGTGPLAVIFLHAFPLDRRMWSRQVEVVAAAGHRAIAVDLAGFGSSDGARSSIDDHAADVVHTLRELRIDRAVFVGISMGGYVAMAMARRAPETITSLVLADTKSTPDTEAARGKRGEAIVTALTGGVEALLVGGLQSLVADDAPAPLRERLRSIAREQSPTGVIATLAALRDRPDSTDALAALSVPVTVIVGTKDVTTPAGDARAMASRMRHATFVEIEGAGHLANLERPDAFDAALLEALRRV